MLPSFWREVVDYLDVLKLLASILVIVYIFTLLPSVINRFAVYGVSVSLIQMKVVLCVMQQKTDEMCPFSKTIFFHAITSFYNGSRKYL